MKQFVRFILGTATLLAFFYATTILMALLYSLDSAVLSF